MSKVGRNDPCLCGSGRKFKKCCGETEAPISSPQRDERAAVERALAWLKAKYPEEIDAAIHFDYLGCPDEDEIDTLNSLPEGAKRMLDINIGEWLLAEARLEIDGKPVKAADMVLGPGGPVLPASGKEWLRVLSETPLGLYEVQRSMPGEGLELKDLLRKDAPILEVRERTASRSLVRWDILGARVAPQDGVLVLSGSLYPMDREMGISCRDEIIAEMDGEEDWDGEVARDLVGAVISGCWLETLTEKRPLPQVVDASTGEPIALTTDRYRVADWDALAGILSEQPDVEGDRAEGWIRFEPLEDEGRRSRASMTEKSPDTLEVFCRTLKLADEARRWLEIIAGAIVEYKGREIVDPTSPKAMESFKRSQATPEIPDELKKQLEREYLQRHYERWPDEPLPALKGKTPAKAVKTKKGREEVIEILKDFEIHEGRRAGGQGGEPFDFGFLWKRLGLEKER